MTVGVLKETAPGEKRVALIPAELAALGKAGCTVLLEHGAGTEAGFPDEAYASGGAGISGRGEVLRGADVLFVVRGAASAGEEGTALASGVRSGSTVIGLLDPYSTHRSFTLFAEHGCTLFALELLPRITRAQTMDVLSSQANLLGYKAAIHAAELLPRIFPMMMTAAGTLVPARVFVVGAGVAGLQAIATSRRLGGVVTAYDVRETAAEQVESLGARFLRLPLEAGKAEDAGGYARAFDEEFYRRQRELLAPAVASSDVVITTAAVPGKPSPLLVTADMVRGMPAESVIIDLASERGGNCELSRAGETVRWNGVTIAAPTDLISSVAGHASRLYSKNIVTFFLSLLKDGGIDFSGEDEIRSASCIMRNGEPRKDSIRV